MARDLKCGCCGGAKEASECVASRLAKRRVLCKACMSARNKRYFASNRHVFLAGVSRRALGMSKLTAPMYNMVLAKNGNKCALSGASGDVVPLVLVRLKQGGQELVPVTRHLATKLKWVLPSGYTPGEYQADGAGIITADALLRAHSIARQEEACPDVGPKGDALPLHTELSCASASATKKQGDALVTKGMGISHKIS